LSNQAPAEAGKAPETATQATAQPVAVPPPAQPVGIDADAFKAMEKRASKAEKEFASLQDKIKSPDFAKELITTALGWGKDEDPKAKYAAVEQRASSAEQRAQSAILRSEATQAALAAGVRPDRIKHALKNLDLSDVKVSLDTGSVENPDVFAAAFASLKTDVPEFFVQAAPPAEKGAPFTGKAPPAPVQPETKPVAPENNANDFSRWTANQRAN
jgi:hypothetical protein